MPAPVPSVGRIVIYRAKTRGYPLPAIVTATRHTLDPIGIERGDVPPLDDDTTVHLHVLTPGAQGSYTEHSIPQGDGPGTWSWPERV